MSQSAKTSTVLLVYLVLVLSTFLVFWQVHRFNFVSYDDNEYVFENSHVLNGLNISSVIWALTKAHIGYWHPLTWLSLMLDCQFFGPDPGAIHVISLLLHIANVLLLFGILRKMTSSLWPSAFVAAAFALHPMHVESVAWISERKDVLSTLFFLLSIGAYVGYVKKGGLFRYLLSIFCFALGLMAKPMLVTLPFILLLLDYWPLNRFSLSQAPNVSSGKSRKILAEPQTRVSLYWLIIEKLPFFILSAVSTVITLITQKAAGGLVSTKSVPFSLRVENAFVSYTEYIIKAFWPQNLAAIYPYPHKGFAFWQVAVSILIFICLSAVVIYFIRTRKYLLVGWLWFIGMLVPVIGLVKFTEQAYSDRYSYVSFIGLFIMVAWAVPEILLRLPQRKIVLAAATICCLTSLGIGAYRQTGYWSDSVKLFSHAIESTENNYVALSCFAQEMSKQGKMPLALEYFEKSIQINPNYPDTLVNYGAALVKIGDYQHAIPYFQKMVELQPASLHAVDAYNNLGIAMQSMGKFDDAVYYFRQAIRLKPDLAAAMSNLAYVVATAPELKTRDVNEAVRFAVGSCELTNFKNPTYLGVLAAAYASKGRFSEAVDTANKAVVLAETIQQPAVAQIIRRHLSFYTRHKPFIESVPNHKN